MDATPLPPSRHRVLTPNEQFRNGERSNNSLADGPAPRPRSFAERLALPDAPALRDTNPSRFANSAVPSAPPVTVAGRLPLASAFRPA
eukprot:485960-Pleurochrysis_carterae.AAC.1